MKDLVSIVIPAYNAANYLAEAIDSALAQTYKNIEIIVVNDGSKDNGATRDVALSYGDKIRYYEKENGGCASALNFGISVMNGKWFSWLSHDDLYLPEKLEKLTELVETYDLDSDKTVLGCNDLIMGPDGIKKSNIFNNSTGYLLSETAFDETLNIKTINGCGLLIPKSILDDVGLFDTGYKHLLDRELWMRIAVKGYTYCFATEALVVSRVHNQQITVKAQDSLFKEEEKLIEDYINKKESVINSSFLVSLCCFAYKRLHYKTGKLIKDRLKREKKINAKILCRIYYYAVVGRIKKTFRGMYKKMLRRG